MNFRSVSDQERLSKFLLENKDFTKSSGNIRWNTLMPMFCEQFDRLETSIFRTSTLRQDKEIWELGDAVVGLKRKPPKAIAVLQAEQIRNKEKLDVIPETSTHPLHFVDLKRKPLKAIAVLQAEQSKNKEKLDVIPETSTHPLHAVIVNWPEDRDGQIEICKELKKEAKLRVR